MISRTYFLLHFDYSETFLTHDVVTIQYELNKQKPLIFFLYRNRKCWCDTCKKVLDEKNFKLNKEAFKEFSKPNRLCHVNRCDFFFHL